MKLRGLQKYMIKETGIDFQVYLPTMDTVMFRYKGILIKVKYYRHKKNFEYLDEIMKILEKEFPEYLI